MLKILKYSLLILIPLLFLVTLFRAYGLPTCYTKSSCSECGGCTVDSCTANCLSVQKGRAWINEPMYNDESIGCEGCWSSCECAKSCGAECETSLDCPSCPPDGCYDIDGDGSKDDWAEYYDRAPCSVTCKCGTCSPYFVEYNSPKCAVCGNGKVESGEVCDPPGSTNPNNNCQECSSDCKAWENKPTSTFCGVGSWETDPDNQCKERRKTYHCSAGSCVFYAYEYRDKPSCTSCDASPYCVDDTKYYNFHCDGSGNCVAQSSKNCNDYDGWYDTGNRRWITCPWNECKECEQKEQVWYDYYCYKGYCDSTADGTQWVFTGNERNKECGVSCSGGRCSGNGFCYSYLGSQTNCPYLNCEKPQRAQPGYVNAQGYKVFWDNEACGRNGLYAVNPSGNTYPNSVCSLTKCEQTPSYTTISGDITNVEVIEVPKDGFYKSNDTIKIKVGVSATSGFIPLLHCQLTKTNRSGDRVGGIDFFSWVTGPEVIFSYKIKPSCEFCEKYHGVRCYNCIGTDFQTKACWNCEVNEVANEVVAEHCRNGCDPSGNWTIDYCELWTDFKENKGWLLKHKALGKELPCVTTLIVPG